MNRILREVSLVLCAVVAVLATFVLSFLLILIVAMATNLTPPYHFSRLTTSLFALVTTVTPLAAALIMSRWLNRRGWFAVFRVNHGLWKYRLIFAIIVGGYGLTAILGVPAVQTFTHGRAVAQYVEIQRSESHASDRFSYYYPRIVTYAAVPLAPSAILVYQEYRLGPLEAYGGFDLFAWYGGGLVHLYRFPIWYS